MNKKLWIAAAVALWLAAFATWHDRCRSAWWSYGIDVARCPDGTPRQSARLDAQGMQRGARGEVQLRATAHYTTGDADEAQQAPVARIDSIELSLIGAHHAPWPLDVPWRQGGGAALASVALPVVPDGDYQLRARYATRLGTGEVTAPLALYAPARIHVITDRPLYEPGNTVRFRAVVLRARDLAPLEQRPGVWTVTDPEGEVLLEEAAPAGAWGVVAGSFPLDKAARTGAWSVAWRSADAIDQVAFTVEPFTLPRARIDALADRAFYRPGDRPRVKGAVLYSSGAPVGAAAVDVTWQVEGAWPPPPAWLDHELPRRARTQANGRFELALPAIPADLQGTATLTAQLQAIDPAGDRTTGVARVVLSQDGIAVSAVTELGDGLAESFNNRLYLRVATPDGQVLANTKIEVGRAWQPGAPRLTAETDEDGVASLQIDPGAPVNIVVPAPPWRPAPPPAVVTRGEIRELVAGQGAGLADQAALDRWLPRLAACAKWAAPESGSIKLALRVLAAGTVTAASAGGSALERCVVAVANGQRLAAGAERLYAIDYAFGDPALPTLTPEIDAALAAPDGLDEALTELARGTRDCLPRGAGGPVGALASLLGWRARAGSKDIELTGWIADPAAEPGARAALPCVMSRIAAGRRLPLAEPATSDGLGVARFTLAEPAGEAAQRPQPTTMLGYELEVAAATAGHPSTRLRVAPGAIPDLRIRVAPVLANPGEPVTAQLIRGPKFTGALPPRLALDCAIQHATAPLDAEHRATLALDATTEGWCTVSGGGVRGFVYVRPRADLTVSVTPGRDRYAPGDRAELAIQTRLGGKGGRAAVGLFGVDESLGQLTALPTPETLGRLRPQVESSAAFGFDGQALALGRIRGANAAAATVMRVTAVPAAARLDAVVDGHATSAFDPIEELTDRFYGVLAELHVQARAWEATAPASEKMAPATMARLWRAALAACSARGERITDAYGRPLRLSRLPADLLSLTDPRQVVVVATRLPEDVENWPAWVAKETP